MQRGMNVRFFEESCMRSAYAAGRIWPLHCTMRQLVGRRRLNPIIGRDNIARSEDQPDISSKG